MPNNSPPVGFNFLVAPINSIGGWYFSSGPREAFLRHVHELPGGIYARTKVAPTLRSALRSFLQLKEIPPSNIALFLNKLPNEAAYDMAFRILWAFLEQHAISPLQASLAQVAAEINGIHRLNPRWVQQAFYDISLFPGFESLRCHPLLLGASWNAAFLAGIVQLLVQLTLQLEYLLHCCCVVVFGKAAREMCKQSQTV